MNASPTRYCTRCNQLRPESAFYRTIYDRIYNTCLTCRTVNTTRERVLRANSTDAPVQLPRRRRARTAGLTDEERQIQQAQRSADRTAAREALLISEPIGFLSKYTLTGPHTLGRMVKECDYCQAYHFTGEETSDKEFEACCKKGDAVLDPLRVPLPYLQDLYQNPTDPISREFRQHIRSYNSALAFTSVSYNKDLRRNRTAGIQCFQIHGDLFHYQGPLDLSSQEAPQFAQLFFYDSDFATRTRHARNPTLNPTTLRALTDMLFEYGPRAVTDANDL
ncbi:hypothetical protein GcM3_172008 [Golovinomyces cichoracearum]|uniref:Helitron helicase-like domain-containing protein n=1 Tax=Golovinomyces cichoracearum TaxID=62708 RepID=A0A420HQN4_9PEZI|nr:hypothetical protein GcM3_172008 [Golovinomyces cichoracearum]